MSMDDVLTYSWRQLHYALPYAAQGHWFARYISSLLYFLRCTRTYALPIRRGGLSVQICGLNIHGPSGRSRTHIKGLERPCSIRCTTEGLASHDSRLRRRVNAPQKYARTPLRAPPVRQRRARALVRSLQSLIGIAHFCAG